MCNFSKEENERNFTRCITFQEVHSFSFFETAASDHLRQILIPLLSYAMSPRCDCRTDCVIQFTGNGAIESECGPSIN